MVTVRRRGPVCLYPGMVPARREDDEDEDVVHGGRIGADAGCGSRAGSLLQQHAAREVCLHDYGTDSGSIAGGGAGDRRGHDGVRRQRRRGTGRPCGSQRRSAGGSVAAGDGFLLRQSGLHGDNDDHADPDQSSRWRPTAAPLHRGDAGRKSGGYGCLQSADAGHQHRGARWTFRRR